MMMKERAMATTASRRWAEPVDVVLGRLAGAGLLAWMGWIHLHLWSQGYRHIASIGYLFMLNFIGAVLAALGVLAAPRRYLALAAAGGALMVAGTLVGLAVSINIGLLGFRDSLHAPFAHQSIWVEAAALVVLTAITGRAIRALGPRPVRPPS
jgi:hypothetical protein